jgi:hypothetical protein
MLEGVADVDVDHLLEFRRMLAWPMTTVLFVLLFRQVICGLAARLSQASLPGGVTLDFQKELAEARSLSREVADEKQKNSLRRPSYPLSFLPPKEMPKC